MTDTEHMRRGLVEIAARLVKTGRYSAQGISINPNAGTVTKDGEVLVYMHQDALVDKWWHMCPEGKA